MPLHVLGTLPSTCDVYEEDIEMTISDEEDSDENDPRTSASSTTTINWESNFSDIVLDARTQPCFPAQLLILIRNPSH